MSRERKGRVLFIGFEAEEWAKQNVRIEESPERKRRGHFRRSDSRQGSGLRKEKGDGTGKEGEKRARNAFTTRPCRTGRKEQRGGGEETAKNECDTVVYVLKKGLPCNEKGSVRQTKREKWRGPIFLTGRVSERGKGGRESCQVRGNPAKDPDSQLPGSKLSQNREKKRRER